MFAHAVIVDPSTGLRYERGHEVPTEIPGFDDLLAAGSVREEPFEEEPSPPVGFGLTPVNPDDLTERTREELQAKGLLVRVVTDGDSGAAQEEQR